MSDFRIGSGQFFSQGIDKITHVATTQSGGLPEQQLLTPAAEAQRPLIDELLALPNMASFLQNSIRPEIGDGDMLLGANFREAHQSALKSLQTEAEKCDDPAGKKLLNRATRLLQDDKALRDLVDEYRNALHQG